MKNLILLLSFILISFDVKSSNKGFRKSSNSRLGKRSLKNTNQAGNEKSKTLNTKENTEIKTEEIVEIDGATCDSEYTRCMNKICTSDTLGKCLCYEDKITNTSPLFIDVDGMKVKQGFEALEFAKKQCVYILDKCKNERRSITEKYKNLVQRDCLMISKNEISKPAGVSGDLEKLKNCVKDACTVKAISGYENFTYPEYSLCFNESYAKFSVDAFCSNIVKNSSSPLGLKQLFLDEMSLKREQSCKSMGGTLSNDRKKCYINIGYGINKENIKKSKQVAVGEYIECSASAFNTKQSETREKRQQDINKILSMTAVGFNTAGAVIGVAGTTDPIGSLIDTGIDIGTAEANLGIDIVAYKKGEINSAQMTTSAVSNGLSISLSSLSFAKGVKEVAGGAKVVSDVAKTAGTTASNLKTGLDIASLTLSAGSQIADNVIEESANKEQMKEEQLDIIKYAEVDRNSGQGVINETLTQKGNCFINKEWFASENEIIMLLWKN